MPFYFSGTNCRAKGEAVAEQSSAPGTEFIASAELWIGNVLGETKVATYSVPIGEPPPERAFVSATFDSTHFSPDTEIYVEIRAWDNLGGFYFARQYAPIKNRALFYNYPYSSVGSYGAQVASNLMSGQNYPIKAVPTGPWLRSTYMAELVYANLVYVAAHGRMDSQFSGEYENGSWLSIYNTHAYNSSCYETRQAVNGPSYPYPHTT